MKTRKRTLILRGRVRTIKQTPYIFQVRSKKEKKKRKEKKKNPKKQQKNPKQNRKSSNPAESVFVGQGGDVVGGEAIVRRANSLHRRQTPRQLPPFRIPGKHEDDRESVALTKSRQDRERVVQLKWVVIVVAASASAALEDDVGDGVDEELQHRAVEFVGDELGNLVGHKLGEESAEAFKVAPLQGIVALDELVVGRQLTSTSRGRRRRGRRKSIGRPG